MVIPATSRVLAVWLLVALAGCGRSEESKVAAAIRAKFPDGKPRCLGLGGSVGIHVDAPVRGTLWYPASGPTSPLAHLFVFWAGPSSVPAPPLVAELVGRGILGKATVQATIDAETSRAGQRVVPGYTTLPSYEHERRSFTVDIYTTEPFDPRFSYDRRLNFTPALASVTSSFPSRLYGDGPLPPADQHYLVPTFDPYATSVVASACFPETLDRVEGIRVMGNLFGGQYEEADVVYDEHPLPWMLTRNFQRTAMAPDTDPITRPRKATIDLDMSEGRLVYVREHWR